MQFYIYSVSVMEKFGIVDIVLYPGRASRGLVGSTPHRAVQPGQG